MLVFYFNFTHFVYRGKYGNGLNIAPSMMREPHLLNNLSLQMQSLSINRRILSKEERLFFRDNGYIIIKNGVDIKLINIALKMINYAIGSGHHIEQVNPHTKQPVFNHYYRTCIEIIDLFAKSDCYSMVDSLFGENNVQSFLHFL